MPMTVITLRNSPSYLRGDLTKWMQEIAVGVYVGNFNSKVRDKLWTRVKENIGDGEATLSYTSKNEQGYCFETQNTSRHPIYLDGVQLVLIPSMSKNKPNFINNGFSNASKYRKIKKYSHVSDNRKSNLTTYIFLDIETEGLNLNEDRIIEIGAIKVKGEQIEELNFLIKTEGKLPPYITSLTGISNEMLAKDGVKIEFAMRKLKEFIGENPIIGYNLDFDMNFINRELKLLGEEYQIRNRRYDLLRAVKKENMFLNSYKLENVVQEYMIGEKVIHRALMDAKIVYALAMKVNGFLESIK